MSARRPRGTGGAYEYETTQGTRWYFKCTVKLLNGDRKVIVRRGFEAQDDALQAMRNLLVATRTGDAVTLEAVTGKIDNPRFIYALLDDLNRIRYVGQTKNPAIRLQQHWSSRYAVKTSTRRDSIAFARLKTWLSSLSVVPVMKILEEIDEDRANEAEERWLRYALLHDNDGVVLNDILLGRWSPNHRSLTVGRKRSEETRKKMSDAQRARYLRERETGQKSRGRYENDLRRGFYGQTSKIV